MNSVQPIGMTSSGSAGPAERAVDQRATPAPAPATKPETERPVEASSATPKVSAYDQRGQPVSSFSAGPKQSESPGPGTIAVEEMLMNALADQKVDPNTVAPDPLVPPVPIKYLSALLLQSKDTSESSYSSRA